MESEREKLILDGNAFYEIDLDCRKKKSAENKKQMHMTTGKTGNRNIRSEKKGLPVRQSLF